MELTPVTDLPEIRPGDDLAELIAERAGDDLESGDVLTVASTVVSKAEGRVADLEEYPVSARAQEIADTIGDLTEEEKDPRFAQAVLEESTELLIDCPFLLTETRFGHINVNAGIDQSNVPGHDLLLLPKRPTKSAERIREDSRNTATTISPSLSPIPAAARSVTASAASPSAGPACLQAGIGAARWTATATNSRSRSSP